MALNQQQYNAGWVSIPRILRDREALRLSGELMSHAAGMQLASCGETEEVTGSMVTMAPEESRERAPEGQRYQNDHHRAANCNRKGVQILL